MRLTQQDNSKKTDYPFMVNQDDDLFRPIMSFRFKTEAEAQLAASLWFISNDRDINDFPRLLKFVLRSMNVKSDWSI